MPTDVARHKKTLPVLYAFEHAGPADRDRLADLYRDSPTRREADVLEIVAILDRAGAARPTPAPRPSAGATRCLAELDGLEAVDSAAREQLRGIITSVISA